MGLITKGIKYGAVALAARHQANKQNEGQNLQQQQAIVSQANALLAQQQAEHEQEQQNLADKANGIIAQQQAEHEQALKEQEEKLKLEHAQQQSAQYPPPHMYPQQALPPPPPQAYSPAPSSPYTQPGTPAAQYRDMDGYQHQSWCNQQCGQSCNTSNLASTPSAMGYGSPAPYGAYPSPPQQYAPAPYQPPYQPAYH